MDTLAFMCYKKERKQEKNNKKEKMHIQSILGTFNGKILFLNRELGMVKIVIMVNIRWLYQAKWEYQDMKYAKEILKQISVQHTLVKTWSREAIWDNYMQIAHFQDNI